MAKAGAHGGTGRERRLDLASGRDRSDGGAVRIGGGETVALGDERTPNEVRRNRNRTRLREPRARRQQRRRRCASAGSERAGRTMIPMPSGVRVWIATGHTDMRRGMQGLALQVQEGLGRDPFAGDVFVFRGRSGSLIKAIWHDGVGLSLYTKRLDRGKFIWPQTVGGVVSLTAGQMGYLLEAIDWRNPQHTWRPQSAG